MEAFLLETTILTISLDARHPRHAEITVSLKTLSPEAPRYISAIGLAELTFGADLAEATGRGASPVLREKIRQAQTYAVLDITHHTAAAYAAAKAKLATKYLASTLRKHRPTYLEDWIDQATGKAIGVDENDLWMCAQAKERDIILVTADQRIKKVQEADPEVRLLLM